MAETIPSRIRTALSMPDDASKARALATIHRSTSSKSAKKVIEAIIAQHGLNCYLYWLGSAMVPVPLDHSR